MQVGGDRASLVVGGRQGLGEQPLALVLAGLEPSGQAPASRACTAPNEQEPTEHDRGERAQDPLRCRVDPVGRLVGLEQQPSTLGILDGDVHLEQLLEVRLVGVLLLGEVGQLRVRRPRREHLLLVGAEGELGAHPLEVVGVQDGPVIAPDLRPPTILVAEHRGPDDASTASMAAGSPSIEAGGGGPGSMTAAASSSVACSAWWTASPAATGPGCPEAAEADGRGGDGAQQRGDGHLASDGHAPIVGA